MDLERIVESGREFWERASAIWIAGGWGMAAIAADAIVLFGFVVHLWLHLRSKGFESVPESTWRGWVARPEQRRGPIGRLLDAVTGADSVQETSVMFQGVRTSEVAPFERDLRILRICVGTAPLLGLFGTITGMLATFGALASGSGGEKTMGLIAKGISEALITTETGLVIALPGLFLQYQLARKLERYRAFLAHVETVCLQHVHREQKRSVLQPRARSQRPAGLEPAAATS
jgi:biopolymer transport protein ExbB